MEFTERISGFFNGLFGNKHNEYNHLNEDDDEKVVDIWDDNDPLMESIERDFPNVPKKMGVDELKIQMPRMVRISGHTYVSLNDTLCEYEKIDKVKDKVLTSKNYLKKNWRKDMKYLDFVDQTYISHIKERMRYFRKASRAAFYLLINAFFPNNFTYTGTDVIIYLGEDILDKYFEVLNKQADKITAEV
jgi:hypothetical protein